MTGTPVGNKFGAALLASIFLLLLQAAVLSPCRAQTAAPEFTLARFLEVPIIFSPTVSADGSQVAWLNSRRSLEDDKRVTRLWLADVKSGRARQLTFTADGVGSPGWRPDGSLSFIRTHEEAAQVWVNPLDGAEPRPVTAIEGGVSAYWWSPDGRYLVVLADPAKPEDEEESATDDDADARDAPVYDVPADREDWTVWDRLEQPDQYQQLWLVEALTDGAAHGLRTPAADHRAAAPVPRGLVAGRRDPGGDLQRPVLQPGGRGAADRSAGCRHRRRWTIITARTHHSSLAVFSPDGRHLAYYTDREEELRAYLNLKDVVVRDLDPVKVRVLTGAIAADPRRLRQHAGLRARVGRQGPLPVPARRRRHRRWTSTGSTSAGAICGR